jgi:hypothetical protein
MSRAMYDFAINQLRLVDPPKGSALGGLLSALRRDCDRLQGKLAEATEAKWRAEDEAADLRRRLRVAEDELAKRRTTR